MKAPDEYGPYLSRDDAQSHFNAIAGPVSIAGIRAKMAVMRLGTVLTTDRNVRLTAWELTQLDVLTGVCDEAQTWTAIGLISRSRPSLWADQLAPWSGPYDSPAHALTAFDDRVAALPELVANDRRRLANAWLTITLTLHQVQLTAWEADVVSHLACHAPIPMIQAFIGWIIAAGQAPASVAASTADNSRHRRFSSAR
ncbi:hypothetical protein AB0B66_10330 [Catellatospora sp. NPDC049111]|uniref:hypothetical protein n=1 Tax=Catellatospora sp. NPDC049111 TaxID=3155271 RepID=UPI0033ED9CE1